MKKREKILTFILLAFSGFLANVYLSEMLNTLLLGNEINIKKWDNRIKTCVISSVGAVLGVVIIDLAIGYFQ